MLDNTTIAPEEVEARAEDVFILDVRPAYSYREEHIDGSYSLPVYDQLKGENFIGLDVSTAELCEETEIAVVCFSGSIAEIAAACLREHGFDARRMLGGLDGWRGTTSGTVEAAQTT